MGLELDWLEREERYRRRVVRLMTISILLVAAAVGTLAYMRTKSVKAAKVEATRAAEAARVAAIKRQRDAFVADSSAAASRYATFLTAHGATPVAGTTLLQIPLAPGTAIQPFVQRLWAEYAHVVDPQASAAQEADGYRQFYIDVMNDGPLRAGAVLLPSIRQEATMLSINKPSFSDITNAQVAIGMREQPVEAAPDTTGMGMSGTSAADPATSEMPAPSVAPPSVPTPAVPAEPVEEPAATPAAVDSTPKP